MEAEKKSSKGGFLQLFDWNAKSRKKLFSNKPDVPECSKHGKENVDNLAISRLQQTRFNEINGLTPSSSNDEGNGTKAPGVVARLMGLDSLPTQDSSDPVFTPHIRPRITTDPETVADYSNRNKLDGYSTNRPFDKFQTEVLPPKSAKSVPITHHKMLSPIKSPGFVLSRNVDFIMEEASKLTDQSTLTRRRDLKQKMEAANRPKTYSPVNSTKRACRSEAVVLKSKINIQTLVGSTSRNSKSTMKQKEDNIKLDKKQSTPKRVLKPNNQKQNSTNLKPRVPYRKTTATSGCKEVKKSNKAVENSPRKARLVRSETVSNNVVIKEKERSVKCNVTIDGSSNCDMKSGMDVVSFTFTSPIKKPGFDSETSGQPTVKSRRLFQEDNGISHVIDSDALSVLLEQKLKELSSLVETSQSDIVKRGSASRDHMHEDNITVQHDRMDLQEVEASECSENYESGIKHEHQHERCTSTSPEPSLSDDSCITSNSTTLTSNGNTQYMSAAKNTELLTDEFELQDSATSHPTIIFESTLMEKWSSQQELEYIKEIVNHAELALNNLTFDPTQKIISVNLFDQMESQHKNIDPMSKQQRKTLFDCVSVSLEDRRAHGLSGIYEEWSKWSTVFEKTGLLAGEIQKQIRCWRSMEELMVDEVVDLDMSNGDGKWLDFKAEGLEEGAVIGTDILTVLIDEIVVEFLLC